MLEAVLFDMDGVIIDTEPFFLRSESMLLKEFGVSFPLPRDHARIHVGNNEK